MTAKGPGETEQPEYRYAVDPTTAESLQEQINEIKEHVGMESEEPPNTFNKAVDAG